VSIETARADDSIVICVRDSGPRIAADQLPHVFDKYWQGNSRAAHKGVGLGLAIAKEIVLAHQGRIWADSQPDQESRFFFAMPCMRAP